MQTKHESMDGKSYTVFFWYRIDDSTNHSSRWPKIEGHYDDSV